MCEEGGCMLLTHLLVAINTLMAPRESKPSSWTINSAEAGEQRYMSRVQATSQDVSAYPTWFAALRYHHPLRHRIEHLRPRRFRCSVNDQSVLNSGET